ncbi:MAG: undecaprenyl-diphosphate phosphatase [Sheuella sp.]|nr:undecaprenyl-diphosphate phosphatase [Sheuella sp.]
MTEATLQLIKAFFLGIVEGITEFLPISSTGHLIIVGKWIEFTSTEGKVFEVVIQLGSILAVMWIFRARLIKMITGTLKRDPVEVAFTRNLIIAFLPSAVIGFLFIKMIKALFFQPAVVVVTLILGGLIMLWVERVRKPGKANQRVVTTTTLESISWKQALIVGFAQCLAMIPGTSRSGSTIIGGMLAGIERKTATEFSFFLAMPTMLAAASYDMYKNAGLISQADMLAIAVGFVTAFLSALLVVRAILTFISKHTYRAFGWYRIVLGVVVGVWLWRLG